MTKRRRGRYPVIMIFKMVAMEKFYMLHSTPGITSDYFITKLPHIRVKENNKLLNLSCEMQQLTGKGSGNKFFCQGYTIEALRKSPFLYFS